MSESFPEPVEENLVAFALISFISTAIYLLGWGNPASTYGMLDMMYGSFTHAGFYHLFTNITTLLIGTMMASLFQKRITIVFILGCIVSTATILFLNNGATVVGISGGVYAVTTYSVMFPFSIIIWLSSIVEFVIGSQPNVGYSGHLAGSTIGLALSIITYYIQLNNAND